jgi:hypothetical protein
VLIIALSVWLSESQVSGYFENSALECHLLGCSKGRISAIPSQTAIARWDKSGSGDFARLLFEALNDLLLNVSVPIQCEDDHLKLIVSFGSGYECF